DINHLWIQTRTPPGSGRSTQPGGVTNVGQLPAASNIQWRGRPFDHPCRRKGLSAPRYVARPSVRYGRVTGPATSETHTSGDGEWGVAGFGTPHLGRDRAV